MSLSVDRRCCRSADLLLVVHLQIADVSEVSGNNRTRNAKKMSAKVAGSRLVVEREMRARHSDRRARERLMWDVGPFWKVLMSLLHRT